MKIRGGDAGRTSLGAVSNSFDATPRYWPDADLFPCGADISLPDADLGGGRREMEVGGGRRKEGRWRRNGGMEEEWRNGGGRREEGGGRTEGEGVRMDVEERREEG